MQQCLFVSHSRNIPCRSLYVTYINTDNALKKMGTVKAIMESFKQQLDRCASEYNGHSTVTLVNESGTYKLHLEVRDIKLSVNKEVNVLEIDAGRNVRVTYFNNGDQIRYHDFDINHLNAALKEYFINFQKASNHIIYILHTWTQIIPGLSYQSNETKREFEITINNTPIGTLKIKQNDVLDSDELSGEFISNDNTKYTFEKDKYLTQLGTMYNDSAQMWLAINKLCTMIEKTQI